MVPMEKFTNVLKKGIANRKKERKTLTKPAIKENKDYNNLISIKL